ncbi:hypothetical protein Y032_0731g1902 [Ancylostoma ceylanicum]|nr:hypothetical protein Y032_0731g1902 [Ancylostoma ceylanicum]
MVPVHPRTDPANPRFEIRGQVGGRAHSIHSAILDLLNIATVGFISFFFENNGYTRHVKSWKLSIISYWKRAKHVSPITTRETFPILEACQLAQKYRKCLVTGSVSS